MLERTRQPMTAEEAARLRGGWLSALIRWMKREKDIFSSPEEKFVDCYRISVSHCFILAEFDETMPLYLLDPGDGMILILFGQWMYDPNTLEAPEETFAAWGNQSFFRCFSLRRFSGEGRVGEGTVFRLEVEGTEFVEAQKLPPLKFKWLAESVLFRGTAATLIQDMERAGLIETM